MSSARSALAISQLIVHRSSTGQLATHQANNDEDFGSCPTSASLLYPRYDILFAEITCPTELKQKTIDVITTGSRKPPSSTLSRLGTILHCYSKSKREEDERKKISLNLPRSQLSSIGPVLDGSKKTCCSLSLGDLFLFSPFAL